MTVRLPIARTAVAIPRTIANHSVNLGYRFRNQLVWLGELLVVGFSRLLQARSSCRHCSPLWWGFSSGSKGSKV